MNTTEFINDCVLASMVAEKESEINAFAERTEELQAQLDRTLSRWEESFPNVQYDEVEIGADDDSGCLIGLMVGNMLFEVAGNEGWAIYSRCGKCGQWSDNPTYVYYNKLDELGWAFRTAGAQKHFRCPVKNPVREPESVPEIKPTECTRKERLFLDALGDLVDEWMGEQF